MYSNIDFVQPRISTSLYSSDSVRREAEGKSSLQNYFVTSMRTASSFHDCASYAPSEINNWSLDTFVGQNKQIKKRQALVLLKF
jgi:hypothetical protein